MAVPLRVFGVSCIVFYLVGSRATKVGKAIKARLEVGHKEAGERDVWQVISNSFAALISAVLWSGIYVPNSIWTPLIPQGLHSQGFALNLSEYCPIDQFTGYSRFLIFAALGHFACCLGDTLASELGILSKSRPILITTLRPVPPGTNGALSTIGTLVSFLGGVIIGFTVAAVLLIQSVPCRQQAWNVLFELTKWGFIAGGVGSILDSLMGATIQKTRYSKKLSMILQDDTPARPEDEVTVVSGVGILTNGQVNAT
ncbi:hypothetical protein Clacol_008539 [Clathrus columnatus]|uniref:Transmembrane protein 19 n=1 Tax=Clathrus columnatus TaxID=1419009 RepID=A0AAV5AQX6_9AGAM|nr:hypothetical protein Clacol_008539 [Clathrus columnatus]